MAESFLQPGRYPHGTRARYVADKCRCERCKGANRVYYHARRRRSLEMAAEVVPNGPPGEKVVRKRDRWGRVREFRFKICPGVNGQPCPRQADPRKGFPVCSECRERATVWNGLVSAERARKHLLQLRDMGIGYKTVAEAAKLGHTAVSLILSGEHPRIRRETERRILAVDQDARADHSIVDSPQTVANIEWLRSQGFTMYELRALLGYSSRTAVYVLMKNARTSGKVLAITEARVERLPKRAAAGELHPAPKYRVPSGPTRKLVAKLLKEGFSRKEIGRRTGWFAHKKWRRMVKASTAAKIRALYEQVLAGDGPDESVLEENLYEIRRQLDPAIAPPEHMRRREESEAVRAATRRRLIEAYVDGVSMHDLVARFDLEERQIYRALKRAGVKRRDEGAAA